MSGEGGPAAPGRLVREVAATAAEFERALRQAWPDGVECIEAGAFVLYDGAVSLHVHVRPDGVRRIGLLELPRLAVCYRFEGGTEAARDRLLAQLDRAMQRGGG